MRPTRVHNFGTYFVTTQTWQRRRLFDCDELARLLLDTIYRYRSQSKFLLHEFVIMPDHLHLILTPNEITLDRAMQLIKGGYSHAVGLTGRSKLEIWQPGYADHRIRDYDDYIRHRDYIHLNPVRAHLCEGARDYPWSSANPRYEIDLPQRLKPCDVLAEVRHG
jgi:putative transposase